MLSWQFLLTLKSNTIEQKTTIVIVCWCEASAKGKRRVLLRGGETHRVTPDLNVLCGTYESHSFTQKSKIVSI